MPWWAWMLIGFATLWFFAVALYFWLLEDFDAHNKPKADTSRDNWRY